MRKLIGVIAVAVSMVVASFAPSIAQAMTGGLPGDSGGCSTLNTEFAQPSTAPKAYTIKQQNYVRRIIVKYSVAGTFTGVCRGFLSGTARIRVKNPDGSVWKESRPYSNLEFKNGFNDTGKRFKDAFDLKYRHPIAAGTCFSVVVNWQPWYYNDGGLVSNGSAKTVRTSGCYQSVP
jgi:hypothetical protein